MVDDNNAPVFTTPHLNFAYGEINQPRSNLMGEVFFLLLFKLINILAEQRQEDNKKIYNVISVKERFVAQKVVAIVENTCFSQ